MSEPPVEDEAEQYKPVSRWFLFLMLRTRKGLNLMDVLGRWRVTRPLAWVMLLIMPFAAALALYVIGVEISALYFSPQSHVIISDVRTISPLANFLLPGINPYLPVSVWFAVIVAVVIHESAHGIVARNLGLKVKSAGVLLLLILPIGAFVEVDDKQLKESRSRDSLRVLGAGSGINFIVGVACVLLLILTVSTMVPAVKGAAIVGVVQDTPSEHSPAYLAGIKPGDFVTALNGSPITDLSVLHNGSFSVGEKVNVTIWRGGVTMTIPNIVLSNYTVTTVNETSGQSSSTTQPFLGVTESSYSSLQSVSGTYANAWKSSPIAYLVEIPTFGNSQYVVPFSTILSPFFSSPLGSWTPFVARPCSGCSSSTSTWRYSTASPSTPWTGGRRSRRSSGGPGRGG